MDNTASTWLIKIPFTLNEMEGFSVAIGHDEKNLTTYLKKHEMTIKMFSCMKHAF